MPLTNSTVAAIDQRTKDDPEFAAAVEAELQAIRIEQELVALRHASGLSQRQLAAKLGVKQPVIAKLASQNWFLYSRKKLREPQQATLQGVLGHARLETVCYLAETQITVEELLNLQPGDIIQTGKPASRELVLCIEGRGKFAGVLGQHRGARALKIMRRADGDERL